MFSCCCASQHFLLLNPLPLVLRGQIWVMKQRYSTSRPCRQSTTYWAIHPRANLLCQHSPDANRRSLPDFVIQAHSDWRAIFRQLHYAVAKGYGAILRWLLIQVRNMLGSFVDIFDRFNYCFALEICPLVLPFDGDTTPRATL